MATVDTAAAVAAVKAAMIAKGWAPAAAPAATEHGVEIVVFWPVRVDYSDLDAPEVIDRAEVADVLVSRGFDEWGNCDMMSRFLLI
jgi:hypothetical protein